MSPLWKGLVLIGKAVVIPTNLCQMHRRGGPQTQSVLVKHLRKHPHIMHSVGHTVLDKLSRNFVASCRRPAERTIAAFASEQRFFGVAGSHVPRGGGGAA